jgi:hypothetical protein
MGRDICSAQSGALNQAATNPRIPGLLSSGANDKYRPVPTNLSPTPWNSIKGTDTCKFLLGKPHHLQIPTYFLKKDLKKLSKLEIPALRRLR